MTAEAVHPHPAGQRFNPEQEKAAAEYLLKNPPGQGPAHCHYWYHATLALSQMRGETWRSGTTRSSKLLVTTQRGGDETEADTNSKYSARGGKVYTTAINALTLEVYYRYLPMYKANPGQSHP